MPHSKKQFPLVHFACLFVGLMLVMAGVVACHSRNDEITSTPDTLGFDRVWLPPNSLVQPGQIWSLNPNQLVQVAPSNMPIAETGLQAKVSFALTRNGASRFVFEGRGGKGVAFGASADLAKMASLTCELQETSTSYLTVGQLQDCDLLSRYSPSYLASLNKAASTDSSKLISSVLSASRMLFIYSGKRNAELEASANQWTGIPLNWRARAQGKTEEYEAVAVEATKGAPVPMLISFVKQEELRQITFKQRSVDAVIDPFTLQLDNYHHNNEYIHGWGGGKYIGLFGACKLLVKVVNGKPVLDASASEKWELVQTHRSPAPFISASGTITKELKVNIEPMEFITDIQILGSSAGTVWEVPYGELFGAPNNTMPTTFQPPAKGFVSKWFANDHGPRNFSVDLPQISVRITLGRCM